MMVVNYLIILLLGFIIGLIFSLVFHETIKDCSQSIKYHKVEK